jgi:hypothetical protein
MLSFRTMLDAERAKEMSATLGFRLGAHHYVGRLEDCTFQVERGDVDSADAVFTCAPTELAAVVYGGAPLESIVIEGDKALAERFVRLFPLPPKAA